jgi:mannose-1-phosphate guanylyltransferase
VITSALISDGVKQQLPQLPDSNCLIEPQGKDTAPAVAWAALEVAKRHGKDAVIGFFPADHCIGNQAAYQATLTAAATFAAQNDVIVTLGITPDYPSTGYGYIEQGNLLETIDNLGIYKVTRFTEKPDEETAKNFLETGKFSWNSGMFIFRAEVVLNELAKYAPEMLKLLQEKGQEAYESLDKISIDYALMEKTQLATVIPADFGWDDLGDWNALERLHSVKDDNIELGRHVNLDTRGAIIYNENPDEVIVTIGLEDVVIVREGNATLIVHKNRTQDIKKALKLLEKDQGLEQLL